jgi:hypothetical protein
MKTIKKFLTPAEACLFMLMENYACVPDEEKTFYQAHDVCVDEDKNLCVPMECQPTAPIKLIRI